MDVWSTTEAATSQRSASGLAPTGWPAGVWRVSEDLEDFAMLSILATKTMAAAACTPYATTWVMGRGTAPASEATWETASVVAGPPETKSPVVVITTFSVECL